ncbi:MAG: DUF3489 domain-containing protein [Alphaproteobacteria bacterium]
MLRRPEGATLTELAQALGWTESLVQATIVTTLRRALGLPVVSGKASQVSKLVYRIDRSITEAEGCFR